MRSVRHCKLVKSLTRNTMRQKLLIYLKRVLFHSFTPQKLGKRNVIQKVSISQFNSVCWIRNDYFSADLWLAAMNETLNAFYRPSDVVLAFSVRVCPLGSRKTRFYKKNFFAPFIVCFDGLANFPRQWSSSCGSFCYLLF